jgi:hypothetical protein
MFATVPLTTAVASLAAEAGLSEQAESIIGRTRGHALFVVETLRALTAGNAGVPVSLEAAVLARVRRAGPSVETVLRAAAVLGASFDPGTVAGLLGERLGRDRDLRGRARGPAACRRGADYEFATTRSARGAVRDHACPDPDGLPQPRG